MRTSTALTLLLLALPLPLACGDDSTDDSGSTSTDDPTVGTGPLATDGPGSETGASDDVTAPGESTEGPDGTTGDGTTGDGTATDPGTTDGTTGDAVDQLPPTNPAQLEAWLIEGDYLGWAGESAVHGSTGPHFGNVRTYVNDALFASLDAGAAEHPMEAATVKELYGPGNTIRGWAVMVKVQADSAGGDGWYWYEIYDDSVLADGTGLGVCTGCHGGGTDYVLTPFPLQ
ncbi:MAG: hypothetical protein AB1Z98_11530 [Nannocystaceae bacterium]